MTLVPNTGPATPGASTLIPGSGSEAYLDAEWAGGVALGATVNYVFTGGDDADVEDATYYAIEQDVAPVLSQSWGSCEFELTPADADMVALYGSAANLLGITYVAASGDEGADGCEGGAGVRYGEAGLYAEIPGAFPGVTAVGGSMFPGGSLTYSAQNTVSGYSSSETTWNEGATPGVDLAAGGGGISSVFSRPSYQSGVPTCAMVGALPTPVDPSAMRQVPDVAVTAAYEYGHNPLFMMCQYSGGDCVVNGTNQKVANVGGTSVSAPAFAGVVALLNQATGGRLGNINPMLYTLASAAPSAFHDLGSGNIEVVCAPGADPGCPDGGLYGYAAAPGYDCATGLGSIDALNLVTAWVALTPTTTTVAAAPQQTTEGASVTLTASVNVPSPNASTLGGIVTFSFESYFANGAPDLSWILGTAPITGASANGGTATLSTVLPPGLVNPGAQAVNVVASYSGDAAHLASTSPATPVTFEPFAFCVSPGTASVGPDGGLPFTAQGGVPPVTWRLRSDTACDDNGNCSAIDSATGAFTAGPAAGYVVVAGLDSLGAEGLAEVTVGSPALGPPWGDAGFTPGACDVDAGPPDAGAGDSSSASSSSSGSSSASSSSSGSSSASSSSSGSSSTLSSSSGSSSASSSSSSNSTGSSSSSSSSSSGWSSTGTAGTSSTAATGSGSSAASSGSSSSGSSSSSASTASSGSASGSTGGAATASTSGSSSSGSATGSGSSTGSTSSNSSTGSTGSHGATAAGSTSGGSAANGGGCGCGTSTAGLDLGWAALALLAWARRARVKLFR